MFFADVVKLRGRDLGREVGLGSEGRSRWLMSPTGTLPADRGGGRLKEPRTGPGRGLIPAADTDCYIE